MEELFQFPSFTHTLQVTGCHFGRKPPGWTYPLHHHHLFELVYCFRGEVEQEISRERLLLREGDWLLIKAGVRHQLANRSEAEYGYFNVHFDLDDDGIRGLLASAPYRHFMRKETEGSKLTSYVKELEQVRDRSRKDPSSGQAGGTDETVPLPFGDLLLLQAYTLLLLHELLALLREDRPSRPQAAAAQAAGRGAAVQPGGAPAVPSAVPLPPLPALAPPLPTQAPPRRSSRRTSPTRWRRGWRSS
ncbi:AraC family ligand binding domain-containing protein [Paenibacillus sp. CC-CFT747]|nr:AraC family ligand binding domain-containing protein [Paenibacillus sp. CC-CFT747]